jgi:hypothetical protein
VHLVKTKHKSHLHPAKRLIATSEYRQNRLD